MLLVVPSPMLGPLNGSTRLGDSLFQDRVVHRLQTPYQNVVITKRHVTAGQVRTS